MESTQEPPRGARRGDAARHLQDGSLWPIQRPRIPAQAMGIALASLAVPVLATVVFPEGASDYEILLWLLALVPAFLLAYYRGWRGAATAFAGGMAVLVAGQLWLLVHDGRIVHHGLLLGVILAYIGATLGIGFLSELLHRERARAERLALTDDLTGLPNRRFIRHMLDREFAAAVRGRPLVIVLFDLDHFKRYNDEHGHRAGDDALRGFADVIDRNTRRMNASGRYGGEEFLSLLSDSTVEGALVFVDRVMTALRHAPPRGGAVTVSAGVAAYSPEMAGVADLLAAADAALYQAKAAGRDCARVYGAQSWPHAAGREGAA